MNPWQTFTGKIDPATFMVLTDEYVKDATQVFGMENAISGPGSQIIGADAPTFKLIDENYEADKDHVYWRGDLIPGSDPVTFVDFTDSAFAKDAHAIYFDEQKVLPQADPATFVPVGERGYGKDKNHVYFCGEGIGINPQFECSTVAVADPSTFIILSDYYAKDKNGVYDSMGHLITGVDLSTFVLLNDFYAKDKNNVYVDTGGGASIVQGADPTTFQVATAEQCGNDCNYTAQDKNHEYLWGNIVQQI